MKLSRRSVLRGSAVALAAPALDTFGLSPLVTPTAAQEETPWRHGLSLFGDLKQPAGFKHFDYVNPQAPKAGTVRLNGGLTFDNFNLAVSRVRGTVATGLNLVYNTLLTDALDEVSTEYGLLAESVKHPPDFSNATYRLRAEAKWHDGRPVTPDDVIFSLEAFKKHDPMYSAYYRHVIKAERTGEREITFTFDEPGNRELPMILGQLTVLPKHWWEGTDANGNKRDIGQTGLEPPLGCGPYRIKSFVAGRTVIYERVKDYWGRDLNVNVGQNNFDEIRFEYFRDSTIALEAFKGDNLDWRTENSALNWATRYDFPARSEKRVILEEFPTRNVGRMQAYVFNTRRAKFSDPRVRRAFNYAFDFEEMNKQLFFGQYSRIASYFEGTELASRGLPEGEELAILKTVQGKVPEEVFTEEYKNPTGGNPEKVRANLRQAVQLLKDAGWEIRDRRLVSVKTKEPMTIEFLNDSPSSERIILFYKPALERLGVTVTVRTVDDAQYQNRLRSWDYDAISELWAQSLSPGNEQRDFWGSPAADRPGSRNYIGIKDPAIDALIERVIFAKNRAELVAATKALDRVLLHNHFVVPQYTYDKARAARWDRFGRPENMPRYGAAAFPTVWWWDAQRAAKTGSRQ